MNNELNLDRWRIAICRQTLYLFSGKTSVRRRSHYPSKGAVFAERLTRTTEDLFEKNLFLKSVGLIG